MTRHAIRDEYFVWLAELVGEVNDSTISYERLLMQLHDTEFTYIIPKDQNRAKDGEELRYRFAISRCREDSPDFIIDMLDGPCSVLEMMVALAIRWEEDTMDDPKIGNRTAQWFWLMIVNLGLGSMHNDRFDIDYVDKVVYRFLNREYDPDGKGGLFRVKHCDRDLRDVEIWYQLCWYIDEII